MLLHIFLSLRFVIAITIEIQISQLSCSLCYKNQIIDWCFYFWPIFNDVLFFHLLIPWKNQPFHLIEKKTQLATLKSSYLNEFTLILLCSCLMWFNWKEIDNSFRIPENVTFSTQTCNLHLSIPNGNFTVVFLFFFSSLVHVKNISKKWRDERKTQINKIGLN